MKDVATALRGAGAGRLLLGSAGIALGLVGVWQFFAHVPASGWVRVAVWLVAGIVVHDGLLAPLGVVSGRLVSRRAPAPARPAVRLAGLGVLTLLLLATPLLATGGLRH